MNLLKALATVSGMTLISRILGFVRDFVIARIFGAGMVTDAFFVAFKLPNLLRRLFAEGAFAQAFVPIFGEYISKGDTTKAKHLVDHVATLLFLILLVVTLLGMAGLSRLQRGLMLDALGSDFVRTARAKGLRENKAVMKHALRTALIPTGTYFAFQAAALFTGATFTERIFSFHGMGMYGVDTISKQDVNGVVAVTAFGGLCYLVGAILADIMVAVLDPRVRLS